MPTLSKSVTLTAAVVMTIGFLPSQAWADRVSGSITRTYVIVEDTDLGGDVSRDVASNTPCFSFGASGVELRLNGFTMTGKGDAITGCGGVVFAGEFGVTTNGQNK